MSRACEAAVPHVAHAGCPNPGIWIICGAPATELWEYGCVHEHVMRKATCADHRPAPGQVGCRRCYELGHDCDMSARKISDLP